jgi:hypothetical protein
MKEKPILIRLFFVLLSFCWLNLTSLHTEPLHGADLNQLNLQIDGMT